MALLRNNVVKITMEIMNILQPIIGLERKNVLFYEMLARPKGVTNIQGFFDKLEATGEIKQFNLRDVVRGLEIIKANPIRISINFSMQTLLDENFLGQVLDVLADEPAKLKQKLVIEVTENHKTDYKMNVVEKAIKALHAQGCVIAIDDINLEGDPRHVLCHMREVSYLKLEGPSWAPNKESSAGDWIVGYNTLGKNIILEGVRDAADLRRAVNLGAAGGQVLEGTLQVLPDLTTKPYVYPWQNKQSDLSLPRLSN